MNTAARAGKVVAVAALTLQAIFLFRLNSAVSDLKARVHELASKEALIASDQDDAYASGRATSLAAALPQFVVPRDEASADRPEIEDAVAAEIRRFREREQQADEARRAAAKAQAIQAVSAELELTPAETAQLHHVAQRIRDIEVAGTASRVDMDALYAEAEAQIKALLGPARYATFEIMRSERPQLGRSLPALRAPPLPEENGSAPAP